MASVSIFNLTAGTALASADVLPFVDVSDHTQSAEGSTLKITVADFFGTVPSPVVVTASSANALAVGQNGATNPALLVDTSTASSATGLKVASAAAGGGVALVVLSSGTDENLTLNAKGAGTIGIGSVSTGRVTITPATTITGALTQTGLATFNGGATVASGQTLTVTGATITGLTAASVGAGTFASGNFTFQGTLTVGTGLTISAGGLSVNAGNSTLAGPVNLANGFGVDLTKHRVLVKTSTTLSLVFTFVIGDSAGIFNTGHVDLSMSSIGNAAPSRSALYQAHFRFQSGVATTMDIVTIGGEAADTVTLTWSGLTGTVTITIPDGGGTQRSVAKCEVMASTSVSSLT